MATDNFNDFNFTKLIASVLGAFVSLRFMQGTRTQRFTAFVGGAALSYYSVGPLGRWLQLTNTDGLMGFLIGLFGMAIVFKLYEVIQLLDAQRIAVDFWDWVSKKWRA